MIEKWVVLLRKAAEDHSYIISHHAFRRMGERDIAEEDVDGCALRGEVIEVQTSDRDVKVLIQGDDCEGRKFYMVVALCVPPVMVTVCRFQKEAWHDQGPFKQRRRRP